MKLEDLGYNPIIEKSMIENGLEDFDIGRVIAEHKERYIVRSESSEYEAEITSNLRFSASSREDFPAVGDWVALINYCPEMAIIHKILPRLSLISRKAVGKAGDKQVIASNIDYAFLVQATDRDFNINRLERYLAICYTSKVEPVIVLTKTDLVIKERLKEIIESVKRRIDSVPLFAISNETKDGYEALEKIIIKGRTYCFLGSSGAEKAHFDLSVSEKRNKDKQFGKMIKTFKKDIQKISGKHNNE
ncbi:MAG: GTPase RsgA [Bacteroidales bacterium]|nr:GTPase RsgA [Bacteroidales bacterium]